MTTRKTLKAEDILIIKEDIMNILYILILVISIFAAYWSGFYCGYLKRENKTPEMPLTDLSEKLQQFTARISESATKKEDDKDSYFNG